MINYLIAFLTALIVAAALTPLVRTLAIAYGIIDRPNEARKIHSRPIAYLGGVAIFTGFAVSALINLAFTRQLAALLVGCLILVIIGVIDDARGLSPWIKLMWQFVAAGVALSGGIGITAITNPFGGTILLDAWRFPVTIGDFSFHITPVANLLSILWMVGLANTMNFLDGLDGLSCGISAIAASIIFLLSISDRVNQPGTALLAVILAGAALGFLPYNFYPARIFMGDSGAYFLGLALAMLAIYSGGKLATASLVLGFPILDAIWAALRRLARGTSPFRADRKHFHHMLLDIGLNQRQAVLTLYAVAAVFGAIALESDSMAKFIALLSLVGLMVVSLVGMGAILARRTPQP